MAADWRGVLTRIRRDHRSGASVLLAEGMEAARLFLDGARPQSPGRFLTVLERFTLGLTASQPSMAAFLTLADALWSAAEQDARTTGRALHNALVHFADGVDQALERTVRRAAGLVRSGSVVLTYSNSTAVRLALWRAMASGRRFEVVCSESRPMREGVTMARRLATLGIPVHLVVDAALADWVERAALILLGADAVTPEGVVNKVGTEPLLRAARRIGVPAYVLADSRKWLPGRLARFWRVRPESPAEITALRHANLVIHNRYFDQSPLKLVSGIVWEGGVARPAEVRRRIARLPVSAALVELLGRAGPGNREPKSKGA